jgi:hypothetical protein
MTTSTITGEHALELGQLLQFLADWISTDQERLNASLAAFIDASGYDLNELHADLHRFAFLLGGNDGEEFLSAE